MEYKIIFEIPDEIDPLVNDLKRKWVAQKITEFIRELVSNEAENALSLAMNQINPTIEKQDK